MMTSLLFGLYLTFPLLVLLAALSDLTTFRLPNWINGALIAFFLVLALALPISGQDFTFHLLSGLLVLSAGFTLFAFGLIGGGDAKFACGIAVWLGLSGMVTFVLLSSIFGGILAFSLLAFRRMPLPIALSQIGWVDRLHEDGEDVPYGVALSAGALLTFPYTNFFGTIAIALS